MFILLSENTKQSTKTNNKRCFFRYICKSAEIDNKTAGKMYILIQKPAIIRVFSGINERQHAIFQLVCIQNKLSLLYK